MDFLNITQLGTARAMKQTQFPKVCVASRSSLCVDSDFPSREAQYCFSMIFVTLLLVDRW